MFIDHKNIKPKSIEIRKYQVNIANSAKDKNTLIVLPTGLGKTVIALFLIADHIKNKNEKILFLAPTKPLVLQHASFLKEYLKVDPEEIIVFTGEVSPAKRTKLWSDSRIIISTPQVIENDLLSKRINLEDVCFIVFDEAHHAVGDYAYVFVNEIYQKQRKNGLLVGMTASPGNDVPKILDVCKNLNVSNIEIRTKFDADVKPYVQDLKIIWKEILLPKEFAFTISLLKAALSKRLKVLKEIEVIESASLSLISKRKLLDAQKKIQQEIRSAIKPSKMLFKAASVQSEAMKIHYALELLQTQGVNAILNYFQRIGKEVSSKSSSKSSRNIMSDPNVIEAYAFAKSLDLEHPKVPEITQIIKEQLNEKPDSKIIAFTHFRDTSSYVCKTLEKVKYAKPVRFVGQASKEGDKGLTQKEQAKIIEQFRNGEYNILIATSVAEEGLDIPSTDLVIFYEPIPSEIRLIQRKGRTGRLTPGKVIIMITKGTPDEGYYWASKRREKLMRSELEVIRTKLDKKFENAEELYKAEMEKKSDQKSLSDYSKKNNDVKVIVDHREYRSNVVRNLNSKGVTIDAQQLDVGDYILSSRIGVERKEVDDFLSSLIDGKLFKQVKNLRDTYSRPILVLEGENLLTKRNINHNAIFGSLASITVDYGVSVLTTKNSHETADLLRVIASREQRDDKKAVAIRGEKTQMSMTERQEFIIEGLPNISAVLAKRLLAHFGSIKDIANASEEELRQVNGVGKNIASEILKVLHSEYLKD